MPTEMVGKVGGKGTRADGMKLKEGSNSKEVAENEAQSSAGALQVREDAEATELTEDLALAELQRADISAVEIAKLAKSAACK
jgi:hypothetical protein